MIEEEVLSKGADAPLTENPRARLRAIKIGREWAMPNHQTFSIPPIARLIERYQRFYDGFWVDPFCGSNKYANYTNDLNPEIKADQHEDAINFLKGLGKQNDYFFFFDPPYSPRQISECYKNVGIQTNMQTTQSSWYSNIKDEISRLTDVGNLVISASWNSNGIGASRGFEIEEILIVAHGGWHNDTIVTVECKVQGSLL